MRTPSTADMFTTWTANQWRSFLAKFIYFFFSAGTIKSHGVVMENTVKDFSTQHFLVAWAFSLQLGTCFFVTPLVSLLQSRFDDRLLAIGGGGLASLGYIIRGLVPLTSVWQLFAMTFVVGTGFGLVNVVTVTSMKTSFQEAFPRAHVMATLGLTLGAATMPLLLEQLMTLLGHDYGTLIFGLFTMITILSGIILPLPEPSNIKPIMTATTNGDANDETSQLLALPSSDNLACGKSKSNRNSTQCRSNWKPFASFFCVFYNHPQFCFLVITVSIIDIAYIGWSIFLVPYGEYLGLDSETAVWLSTIGGSSAFVGRILSIILIHQNVSYSFTSFLLPSLVMVIGYLFSMFFDSFLFISLSALLSGLGIGMQLGIPGSILPLCVCDNCFQTGLVWFYTVGGVTTQLGAILTGGIVDVTGSYRVAFACLAGISLLETIVTLVWTVIPLSKTSCTPPD